jgi:anion-transporting  ArsA/GET3 family ATPase
LVVGKGGVGKSVVAASLALSRLAKGSRVLVMEFDGPGGLSRLFGAKAGKPGRAVEVRPGLFLAVAQGEAALGEYLELVIPIRRLLEVVFSSELYRHFVAAAPGLKELMAVGKVWYEFQRVGADGLPQWNAVVVDAGASGHSLQYLAMPKAAAAAFASGFVHRESVRVAALLQDPNKTAVHVVTTAEEMPTAEATEIISQLRGRLGLPLGRLYVNRCLGAPPAGAAEAVDLLAQAPVRGAMSSLVDSLRRALALWEAQEKAVCELESRTGIKAVRLPFLASEKFGPAQLKALVPYLGEEGQGG